ncbi:MAG: GNAT family N-acetyltransferase [Candidatus Eiseniibacteriota bacterium]
MARDREAPRGRAAPAGRAIRAARPDDLPRIWDMLHGLAAYERLEHEVSGTAERLGEHLFGSRPLVECLVAESGGALVGYALFFPSYSSFQTAPTMWLEDLFVVPGERGRGTGRALMAALARITLDRGGRRLGWLVLDWNRPSIDFYERAGGRPADGGWIEYALDREQMQALAETGAPSPRRE